MNAHPPDCGLWADCSIAVSIILRSLILVRIWYDFGDILNSPSLFWTVSQYAGVASPEKSPNTESFYV